MDTAFNAASGAAPRQALILCAGEGTRLRPLTQDRPKPMLPVGGRPLLEYLIVLLRDQGVREVAINVHYRREVIQAHFGDGLPWGVRIHYSVEERLLGSAGALCRLRDYFTDTFVVMYGDLYTDADVRPLAAFHRRRGALLTMALHEAEEPTREGIVAAEPDTGRVTRFVEKPAPDAVFSRLASAGIFIMEPAALDLIPSERIPQDIGHDLIPALLRAGAPVFGLPLQGMLLDIGSPERYRQADALATIGLATPTDSATGPSLAG